MYAKLQIYKTAILPHLTYCNLVWHFCQASDRNKLDRINKRGLRTVFLDQATMYNDLLPCKGMTSLLYTRLQDIAFFMLTIKNKLLPTNISELFPHLQTHYNLQNSKFYVPRVRTIVYGKHSLRFFGPYLWLKLNMSDRNETSLKRLKESIGRKDLSGLIQGDTCMGCYLCMT